jgi:hypothetical protein
MRCAPADALPLLATSSQIWPENWGWGDASSAASLGAATSRSLAYLREHVQIAQRLGKPLIVEEFGLARDGQRFGDDPTHTRRRTAYYATMLHAAHAAGVSGIMPWTWSGRGRPAHVGGYWRHGDEVIGDPPHELQGWYSIYDTDVATLDVLERAFTERGVTLPPFAPDPPWPPNAPSMACASRHHDDIAVRACESWCSDPSHCSYCKCKACAPLCSSSRKY